MKTTGESEGCVIVVSSRYAERDFVFVVRVQDGKLTVACKGSSPGTVFPNRKAARKATELPWEARYSWDHWSQWEIISVGGLA